MNSAGPLLRSPRIDGTFRRILVELNEQAFHVCDCELFVGYLAATNAVGLQPGEQVAAPSVGAISRARQRAAMPQRTAAELRARREPRLGRRRLVARDRREVGRPSHLHRLSRLELGQLAACRVTGLLRRRLVMDADATGSQGRWAREM